MVLPFRRCTINRKCAIAITCPGGQPGLDGDSPVTNYTAELPDTLVFEGFVYPIFDNNNSIGGTNTTGNFPPWIAAGCQSTCISFLSADDAQACAARQAFICAHTPPSGPPPAFFFNQQQSCTFTCPDGTLYSYTVLPGYFVTLSLQESNALAFALACERAIANHICLGNFTAGTCAGAFYTSTTQLFGVYPLGVEVVSGQLPPGFFLSQDPAGKTATISGTCQIPGYYLFSLMAIDPLGNFHVKNYAISVLAISNAQTLPPFSAAPYSAQLLGIGGLAPYTFALASGSLPIGLTLSSSGLISGTTSAQASSTFSVQMTDAQGAQCTQPVTLPLANCASVFKAPSWNIDFTLPPGPPFGNASGSAFGPNFSIFSSSDGIVLPVQANADFGVSTLELPLTLGMALTCKVTAAVTASGVTNAAMVLNARLQDNSLVNLLTVAPVPVGTSVFSFTIPANAKSLIFQASVAGGNGAGGAGTINLNGGFGS